MLAEYIDGGLDARQRAEVEQHIAECGECYEVFAEANRVRLMEPAVKRPKSRNLLWVAGTAAALAMALGGMAIWRTASPHHDRLAEIVQAVGTNRLLEARLAEDFEWGPRPSVNRGTSNDHLTPSVRSLASELAETAGDGRSAYDAGVALLILGRWDDALERFSAARRVDGPTTRVAVGVSAALLERFREKSDPRDLELALGALDEVLPPPADARWAFNRALALEDLGQRAAATAAWQRVVELEKDPNWLAEAKSHLERLK